MYRSLIEFEKELAGSHVHQFHVWVDRNQPYGYDGAIAMSKPKPLHCGCGARAMMVFSGGLEDVASDEADRKYFFERCGHCSPLVASGS